jgi:SAM-dependent methyltransferase
LEREIQQQFGAVAENYVASAVHARGEDLPVLLEAVGASGDERVLDLGTAVGHTAFTLAPRVGLVTGVDLTAEMLQRACQLARERAIPNVTFARADVGDLPFADATFDVVTSRYSAHHYLQPARVVAEVARVLKPGGAFVLSDTVAPNDPALDTFVNAVELLRDRSHVRDHTIGQWQAYVAAVGMSSDVVHTWDLRLEFDEWVSRMNTPAQAVAMLRTLLTGAPAEARRAFHIETAPALSFCLKGAIVRGRKGDR